jgi:2-ketocyclohexanecarboxyl-CoA hydrolase
MVFSDILYEKADGIATVTLNRPQVMNAFRARTVDELIQAFNDAWADREIGVVVLTGAGDRAFCVGGDQKARGAAGNDYGGQSRSDLGLDIEDLHTVIRSIPKPVIAAVNGYAIGGGHVLHVVCDLSIASDQAVFGQVGPRVGSVDPGFGTAYLARVVGEKKAREIWYLCRQYSAAEAEQMGLVNKVVPHAELMSEVHRWCDEILDKSPTALKLAKYSFNADTAHIAGIAQLGMSALGLYYGTEEAREGNRAFIEKRPVNFRQFRRATLAPADSD